MDKKIFTENTDKLDRLLCIYTSMDKEATDKRAWTYEDFVKEEECRLIKGAVQFLQIFYHPSLFEILHGIDNWNRTQIAKRKMVSHNQKKQDESISKRILKQCSDKHDEMVEASIVRVAAKRARETEQEKQKEERSERKKAKTIEKKKMKKAKRKEKRKQKQAETKNAAGLNNTNTESSNQHDEPPIPAAAASPPHNANETVAAVELPPPPPPQPSPPANGVAPIITPTHQRREISTDTWHQLNNILHAAQVNPYGNQANHEDNNYWYNQYNRQYTPRGRSYNNYRGRGRGGRGRGRGRGRNQHG